MFALCSSLALGGCLALDKVELPEIPDYPPSVIDDFDSPNPSTGILELDFSGDPLPDPVLMVVVRDPNIAQPLTVRVFIDGLPGESRARVSQEVAPTGSVDRDVTVTVPAAQLRLAGCHRMELMVSGEFANGVDQRLPLRTNDFASLVWWVRSTDGIVSDVDLTACPTALTPVQRDPS
ncbi:MAG: hypothetical protein KC593_22275 [Myxococcales bacterium]|nr:hypothetical protein [Myxococcales bacterium]